MKTVARTLAITSLFFFVFSVIAMAAKQRPAPKSAPKPAPKSAPKPAPKPVSKPKPKPALKPAPKSASKPKPAPRPAPPPAPKPVPIPGYSGNPRNDREIAVFNYVNNQRALAGAGPLTWNNELAIAAQKYADLLAVSFPETGTLDHYFGGTTPEQRAKAAGFSAFRLVGENAYEGLVGPFMEPDGAIIAWMNSTAHRENLLNPGYTMTGVGVAVDAEFNIFYVQDFALPK